MSKFCDCQSPSISGDKCFQCYQKVAPEKLDLLANELSIQSTAGKTSDPIALTVQVDEGTQAALRVRKYGTLWDKIGSVINVLNSVGAGILLIFLLVSGIEAKFVLLGIMVIAVLWGLSYLQISIIKGVASYFQMRSADYLEQKAKK